jgi:osmotically-inducible protein OsmY
MNKHSAALWLGMAAVSLWTIAGCSKPPGPTAAAPAVVAVADNVNDVDVTTNVKTALQRDDALKAFDIGVVTLKGDVRLTGAVDNQGQIDAALKIARGADGVHSIHDELTVKK